MDNINLQRKTAMKMELIWSLFSIQFNKIHSGFGKDIEDITTACKGSFVYRINKGSEKIKYVEETFNNIIYYYLDCALECNGYLFVNVEKLKIKSDMGYFIDSPEREFYKIFRHKELRGFFFTKDEYDNYQIDSINKYIMGPSGEIKCQIDELVSSFRAKLKIPDNENYKEYCDMVFNKFKSVFDERLKRRKRKGDYYTRVIQDSYNEFCNNIKESESLILLSEIIEDGLIKTVFDKIYEKMESIEEYMTKESCTYSHAIKLLVLRSEVENAELKRQLSISKEKENSRLGFKNKRRI